MYFWTVLYSYIFSIPQLPILVSNQQYIGPRQDQVIFLYSQAEIIIKCNNAFAIIKAAANKPF